jgi:hypothetical protein
LLFLQSATAIAQRETVPKSWECRLITASDLLDAKAPTFEGFKVTAHQIIRNPKLDLRSNPVAKRYRTVIRQEIMEGPNYAGNYRVAVWGCGSSCAMFAVVNLKTGRVITPKDFGSVSGVHFETEAFLPNTESPGGAFRYKKNSRLLVVLGALDEDDSREGAFYFTLQGEKLLQVHETIVEAVCHPSKP